MMAIDAKIAEQAALLADIREPQSADARDLTRVLTDAERADAAIRACQDLDHHHERRRWALPWLNKALPACASIHYAGFALQAVAAAVLLTYSTWLVHDHLDSQVAPSLRLPRNPGLLTDIKAAIA
jgi:hypothetical protein